MPGSCPDFAALDGNDSEYDDEPSSEADIQLPELVVRAIQVSNAYCVVYASSTFPACHHAYLVWLVV